MDYNTQYRKIHKYLEILDSQRYCNEKPVENIRFCHCDYKKDNTPPADEVLADFKNGDSWGTGIDSHAWFCFHISIPEEMQGKPVQLKINTERKDWDACNPQFICYINGKMIQGLDTNHTFVSLDGYTDCDVAIYGYTGPRIPSTKFFAHIRNVNTVCEQLYYDIRVPFEAVEYLDTHSREYAMILCHLDNALSLVDMFHVGSEDFFASLNTAKGYMDNEFYGKYCKEQPETTICIGHTHIDCAWLWTLRQTREKVQRSFATVTELMRKYPEYKFMSSQALLYKNLKEEAPSVYQEVKELIKEKRWECEGAMWVEADCNLSSGESLLRQVLYGKTFFKNEFGVDNRVLWLPDVFGYSAALPQILRGCGVEWFVTSKISWNDDNMMPYDTFTWRGIDGTGINTYFLTAQDKQRNTEPCNGTTYVGNTGSKMMAGTYYRYQQKNLSDEALLTFGHGDGGGGPTAEHLELARRSAKGIPGIPNAKIEFAGDFLRRLEKRIEGNKNLPSWSGELYLEFHRGTYTSIAKNKRNNRQSEFLYLDTELLASINSEVNGTPFPKEKLHKGWEMILTNQFHDIIPGSSIVEVYDQCDIDYAELKSVANCISNNAKADIASKIDKAKGYVVFNPHSFAGNGYVNIDGKTVYVEGIPSKGYGTATSFKDSCKVVIDGKTVNTDVLQVVFDDDWHIVSVFDKVNEREVLASGAKANEIRLYADHPDQYDNWEWQSYSNENYKVLSAVESAEAVNDGVRKGIKLVRPYNSSKITQTIWFTDNSAKIDFDTVADWHEHHIMVKAAFPVDINSDKASYEIQFGTLERPTHKNTSWDASKFEVCAQKYADLSDGGYGVSIINDCKYGHDIHGNVIMLSLLKCGTYPNEDADQGEIPFVYSIYPHAGTLGQADTAKLAYYHNYPLTAVKATGESSTVPESFSAVSFNKENVVCETVKQAENSNDIIIRFYEAKNRKGKIELTTDFEFSKAYLCDMMENNLTELEAADNKLTLDVRGFEIVTVKLCK